MSSKKSSKTKKGETFSFFSLYVIIPILVVVGAVIYGYLLMKNNKKSVANLMNADIDKIKTAIFNEKPSLIYCQRGGIDFIPEILSEINEKSNEYGISIVNCSQRLPSGNDIWQRFKLKKDWRPTIFANTPWSKPKQIPPKSLKEYSVFKQWTDANLAPRAQDVFTDRDLSKFCGYQPKGNETKQSKQQTKSQSKPSEKQEEEEYDEEDEPEIKDPDACIVLIKGKMHSKQHLELEERLVRSYPKTKIAIVDGRKRRFSFEDPEITPVENFALAIHAIKNGTHYLSMFDSKQQKENKVNEEEDKENDEDDSDAPPSINPYGLLTWDYLDEFVNRALLTPMNNYHTLPPLPSTPSSSSTSSATSTSPTDKETEKTGLSLQPIYLQKLSTFQLQKNLKEQKRQRKRAQREKLKKLHQKQKSSSSLNGEKDSTSTFSSSEQSLSPEELAAAQELKAKQQREREQARREEMDRLSRNQIFEDDIEHEGEDFDDSSMVDLDEEDDEYLDEQIEL